MSRVRLNWGGGLATIWGRAFAPPPAWNLHCTRPSRTDRVLSARAKCCRETGRRKLLAIHSFILAKFHYTDPTGPARTLFAARVSEKLRRVRAGLRQSPCGSGRSRVVEFSLFTTKCDRNTDVSSGDEEWLELVDWAVDSFATTSLHQRLAHLPAVQHHTHIDHAHLAQLLV